MNRKRIVFITLACMLVLSAAVFFTACGDEYADSEYVGKWKCTSGSASGYTIDVEKTLGKFEIELKADGTAEANILGEKSSGEWEPSDDGFSLKDNDNTLDFTKDGNNVKIDYQSVTMIFEKQ